MSKGAARTNLDMVDTHTKGDETHEPNLYIEGSSNVFINGEKAVRVGDKSVCEEEAGEGSSTVFVNGKPLHRKDDATVGHDGFSISLCLSGSEDVVVGD